MVMRAIVLVAAVAGCGRVKFADYLHDAPGGDAPSDAASCGSCAIGYTCGTMLSAPMTTQPAGWRFNAAAYWSSAAQTATLTDAVGATAGTIVYQHAIAVDTFDAHFEFAVVPGSTSPGDGLAFMLETDGPAAVGGAYAGLGVAALHGYGFELDTFNNGNCGDTSANHTGIDTLDPCGTGGLPNALVARDVPFAMRGTGFHAAVVDVASGAASITLDGTLLIDRFALPGFVAGTPYYFGFGAGNGGNYDAHQIKDVAITFPTARCL